MIYNASRLRTGFWNAIWINKHELIINSHCNLLQTYSKFFWSLNIPQTLSPTGCREEGLSPCNLRQNLEVARPPQERTEADQGLPVCLRPETRQRLRQSLSLRPCRLPRHRWVFDRRRRIGSRRSFVSWVEVSGCKSSELVTSERVSYWHRWISRNFSFWRLFMNIWGCLCTD